VSDDLVGQLRAAGVDVRADAPLASLTTLRVGGSARALVAASTDEDLAAVGRVCAARGVRWTVIGRGSNLIVADAGWPGVVIVLGRGFRGVRIDGTRVVAGAAEPLPAVAARVAEAGLSGFAWASAVPGTIGGAVRMNAGAHGGQMADVLDTVDVVRLLAGARETWPVDALGLGYRRSGLPDDAVVVSATIALAHARPEQVGAEIAEIRAWRRAHQPINEPSCGSVFVNPPGDSAGRLVEAAGAKGWRSGGAQVSVQHANFIVTRPGATAADVLTLIERVRARVKERFGVELRTEVVVLGDPHAAAPAS
jgi:UDP-N-acetylmuramate dehydrogenase